MRRRGRSGSGHDEGLVDVELVDGPVEPMNGAGSGFAQLALAHPTSGDSRLDSPTPESRDPEASPPSAQRTPRQGLGRRGLRWWAGAVTVTALVAVAAGANVAEARRSDARRAALAGAPGAVASLAQPLRETWHVQGNVAGQTLDVMLLASREGLQAVDPATGEVLWTRPGTGLEYCYAVGVVTDELTGLPATGPDDAPATGGPQLLACPPTTVNGGNEAVDFGPVAIEILDAATGEVRNTLTTSGALVGPFPFERDVVMVLTTPEGKLRLTRWDPRTGDLLFDVTSAEPVAAAGTATLDGWTIEDGTLTVFTGRETGIGFSLTTGLELPAADVPADPGWTYTIDLPDGAQATWTSSLQTGAGHGQVTEADGTVRFELADAPWWTPTTDGSVPEVMFVIDYIDWRASALNTRTGRELWGADVGGAGQPLVRVDGILVVNTGALTIALDVRDGHTLWSFPAAPTRSSGLTDGEVVVLVEPDGSELVAVARTLRDGEERWRTPLPPATYFLTVLPGGHVVAYTPDGVFGLG